MALYTFLVEGAQAPVVPFEFFDGDNNPIDVRGKTVTFTMRPWNDNTYIVQDQAAVVNSANPGNTGYFALSSEDVVAGHHLSRWYNVEMGMKLPPVGYEHVIIQPDL